MTLKQFQYFSRQSACSESFTNGVQGSVIFVRCSKHEFSNPAKEFKVKHDSGLVDKLLFPDLAKQ